MQIIKNKTRKCAAESKNIKTTARNCVLELVKK